MVIVREYAKETSENGWADRRESSVLLEKKLGLQPKQDFPANHFGEPIESPTTTLAVSFKAPASLAIENVLRPNPEIVKAVQQSVRDGLMSFCTLFNGIEPKGKLHQSIQTLSSTKTFDGKTPVPEVLAHATIPLDDGAHSTLLKKRVKTAHRLLDACVKSHLAFGLKNMGYHLESKGNGFELTGMSSQHLLSLTLSKSDKALTSSSYKLGDIQNALHSVFSEAQFQGLNELGKMPSAKPFVSAEKAWNEAINDCFKDDYKVPLSHLQTVALQKSLGSHLLPKDVKATTPELLTKNTNGLIHCTTPGVQKELQDAMNSARSSKGSLKPLRPKNWAKNAATSFSQDAPLKAVLTSANRVNVFLARDEQHAQTFLENLQDELAKDGKATEVIKPQLPSDQAYFNPATYRVEVGKVLSAIRENKGARPPDLVCIDNVQALPDRSLGQLLNHSQQSNKRMLLLQRLNEVAQGNLLSRFTQKGLLPVVNRLGEARTHLVANDKEPVLKDKIKKGIVGKFASAIRAKNNTLTKGS